MVVFCSVSVILSDIWIFVFAYFIRFKGHLRWSSRSPSEIQSLHWLWGIRQKPFQQKSVESAEQSTFKFDSLIGHSSNPGAWSESEVPVPGFGVRIFFFGHGGSGRGSYAVLWKAETEIQDSFVRSNETGQQRLRFSLIN